MAEVIRREWIKVDSPSGIDWRWIPFIPLAGDVIRVKRRAMKRLCDEYSILYRIDHVTNIYTIHCTRLDRHAPHPPYTCVGLYYLARGTVVRRGMPVPNERMQDLRKKRIIAA